MQNSLPMYYINSDMAKHFGQFIQRKRQEKFPDLSQDDFAVQKAEVSRSTVQLLEKSAETDKIKERLMNKVAKAIGTPYEKLLVEFGEPRMTLTLQIPHSLYADVLKKITAIKRTRWDQEDVNKFIESAIRAHLLVGIVAKTEDDDDSAGGSSMKINPAPPTPPGKLSPGRPAARKAAKEQPRDVEDDD